MSDVAAEIVIPILIEETINNKRVTRVILPTGHSPEGMYKRTALSQAKFDASLVETFNLDGYVGLSPLHPQDYGFFMGNHLHGKMVIPFVAAHIPSAPNINTGELEDAIEYGVQFGGVELIGKDDGKAVYISDRCMDPQLRFIQDKILNPYEELVLQKPAKLAVVGCGGKGHVAFDEAKIPWNIDPRYAMLVKLDERTIADAIEDGYFTEGESPHFALTMRGSLIEKQAENVLVLASGRRKAEPIARSLMDRPSSKTPLSIMQRYTRKPGDAIYVLDRAAAAELPSIDDLADKGYKVEDRRVT